MRGTFFNAGSSLSIGVFFSLMIVGLAAHAADDADLGPAGARRPAAGRAADRAAPAGREPVRRLPRATTRSPSCSVRPAPCSTCRTQQAATLTGTTFFPQLISGPFHDGLVVVFVAATMMMLIAAVASFATGREETARAKPDAHFAAHPARRGAATCMISAGGAEVGEDRGMTAPSGPEAARAGRRRRPPLRRRRPARADAAPHRHRRRQPRRPLGALDALPGGPSRLGRPRRPGGGRRADDDPHRRSSSRTPGSSAAARIRPTAEPSSSRPPRRGRRSIQGESFARSSALRRRVAALSRRPTAPRSWPRCPCSRRWPRDDGPSPDRRPRVCTHGCPSANHGVSTLGTRVTGTSRSPVRVGPGRDRTAPARSVRRGHRPAVHPPVRGGNTTRWPRSSPSTRRPGAVSSGA